MEIRESALNAENFNLAVEKETITFLDSLKRHFNYLWKEATIFEKAVSDSLDTAIGKEERINLRNNFENKKLKFLVLDQENLKRTYETPQKIIRKYDPGYMKASSKYGRAHFYAPSKMIGNKEIDTFLFNLLVLWFVTLVLYITLYFNLLQKIVTYFENLQFAKTDKQSGQFT